jgi:HEAT repeat protein
MSEWVSELDSPDGDTRFKAAGNLGFIDARARSTLPDLLRVLRTDKDPAVRSQAAFAIYKISSNVKRLGVHATEILEDVVPALDDPEPLTRMNAAMALGTLEEDACSALPALEKAIRNKENARRLPLCPLSIREFMLTSIGFMGSDAKDSLPLLEELLLDDDETTRKVCAQALGKLGPAAKHAVKLLRDAIENPAESQLVKESAKEAIKLIDPDEAVKLADK